MQVPRVLGAVFDCTLAMITHNMEDYPEHRINFFQLLKEINHACFRAFFMIPADAFRVTHTHTAPPTHHPLSSSSRP